MKPMIVAFCVAAGTLAASAGAQVAPRTAIDVSAEEIKATVDRTADRTVSDQAVRMVDLGAYDVGVGVVHRQSGGAQGSIEHSKITEVYHVMEGGGTLVTGGTIPDAKPSAPESPVVTVLNGPSNAGTSITGGVSRHIKAGDVIIIPPNTPHWFSEIDGRIVYLVVRVDPDKVVRLK